jgi:transcriptional regulator with XRE-family HTH domain
VRNRGGSPEPGTTVEEPASTQKGGPWSALSPPATWHFGRRRANRSWGTEASHGHTALGERLARAMARWINPQTQMPGISQRRLAERTCVSQTQLHAIIKKGHSPGPEILIKSADFFGANPLSLFALSCLGDGGEAAFEARRSDQAMIESGFPWCVVGDQGDAMAFFKHKHHAEAFCILANVEEGEESQTTGSGSGRRSFRSTE